MKKLICLIIMLFLFAYNLISQNNWYELKLNDFNCTISFPQRPLYSNVPNPQTGSSNYVYSSQSLTGSSDFIFMCSPTPKESSYNFNVRNHKDKYLNSIISQGLELLTDRYNTYHGYETLDYKLKITGTNIYIIGRLIIVNKNIFSLSYIYSSYNKLEHTTFFNSLVITE